MGLIELLLGVVFVLTFGTGIGLGAMGDAGNFEFWIARAAFIIAALALVLSFWIWWLEADRPNWQVIILGTVAGALVFVGLPFQLQWLAAREAKIKSLEQAAHTAEMAHTDQVTSPTESERPDVIIRFVYPDMPALVLINQSGKIARGIKWSVALWNIDDPRTYVNPGAAPNAHDPLPIPVATFDFLRPHTIGGPQTLFNTPLVLPHVKTGQRLAGSASVVCPECGRGHTYLLHIIFGQGGWYTEVLDKKEGELIYPHHFTKELVASFYNEIDQVPELSRIPIQNN